MSVFPVAPAFPMAYLSLVHSQGNALVVAIGSLEIGSKMGFFLSFEYSFSTVLIYCSAHFPCLHSTPLLIPPNSFVYNRYFFSSLHFTVALHGRKASICFCLLFLHIFARVKEISVHLALKTWMRKRKRWMHTAAEAMETSRLPSWSGGRDPSGAAELDSRRWRLLTRPLPRGWSPASRTRRRTWPTVLSCSRRAAEGSQVREQEGSRGGGHRGRADRVVRLRVQDVQ
ncbi:hypothetical protein HPP92_012568 [Vanilla planifolia]|uniref:Uncharacterized protein n=1 Tax=Vanilla planifolia TaxID=51239 RepID=A0A835UVY0_VANPL|nr:hypothetical protein HPP92_012568 [Vanilla planifolia]